MSSRPARRGLCTIISSVLGVSTILAPAGNRVAVDQDRGRRQIRDTRNDNELITLKPPGPIDIASVARSPDGRQLFVLSARHRRYAGNRASLREELTALRFDRQRSPRHCQKNFDAFSPRFLSSL